MKARPGIEEWLAKATDEQRVKLDEFIGVIEGVDGGMDSGCIWDTVEALLDRVDAAYLKEVIDMVDRARKPS